MVAEPIHEDVELEDVQPAPDSTKKNN